MLCTVTIRWTSKKSAREQVLRRFRERGPILSGLARTREAPSDGWLIKAWFVRVVVLRLSETRPYDVVVNLLIRWSTDDGAVVL